MASGTVRSLAFALALAATLVAGPSLAERPLKKFSIVAVGTPLHQMLLYIADRAGYFRDEGLDLDSIVVNSGPKVVAAIQGGAEMGFLGCTEITTAAARGSDLAIVGNGYDAYATSLVLSNAAIAKTGIVRNMSIEDRLKRLKGLRIGITGPGSVTDLMIRSLFLARGMDPDKEVTLQPLGDGASQYAAMERGMIDGFIFGAPFPQIAVARKIGQIAISPLDENIPEMKGMLFICFASSKKTIGQKPEMIQSAINALTKAIALVRNDPEKARHILRPQYAEVDQAIYNAAFDTYVKGIPLSPIITPEELKRTMAWRNIGMDKPMSVPFENVIADGFAEKAAKVILKK